jgi:ABC-2 type transport system ATP-binding protein
MVEIRNISKKFGGFVAVNDISFSLRAGDILGFLGPNGAGKSTTMKILSGYILPTSGSATINNHSTTERRTKKLVGYLPETVPLYKEMKVREFLQFIASVRQIEQAKKRIQEILELTFLEDVVEQNIGTLSKGYRQRIGFAQAIIHDPPVLILDEPTDGLDPNQKQEVRNIITRLSKDKAIILSTHILEEMEAICNRVIILNRGEIVIDTTPQELLEKSTHYHHIEIYFEEPQAKSLKQELEKIVGVQEVIVNSSTKFIIVPKPDAKNLFTKIVKYLEKEKIAVKALSTHQAKADEVFRRLTL